MDVLHVVFPCLAGRKGRSERTNKRRTTISAKQEEKLAADVVNVLFSSDGQSLKQQLDDMLRTYGWYESLAKRILNRLINALNAGKTMGGAMKRAFDRAYEVTNDFVQKHPIFAAAIITVIAIGVLVLLVPLVVEALGFAELGPVEGESFHRW